MRVKIFDVSWLTATPITLSGSLSVLAHCGESRAQRPPLPARWRSEHREVSSRRSSKRERRNKFCFRKPVEFTVRGGVKKSERARRISMLWGISLPMLLLCFCGCSSIAPPTVNACQDYTLDYDTPVNPTLQAKLEKIDTDLRARFGMTTEQTAVGVLDLETLRLAMIHPDRGEYAASVPKIGILLAYFQLHPQAATNLDAQTRHELGLMAKASDNEMATKFSQEMGLTQIQAVLDSYHFYERDHGGGIWIGKHYGKGGERIGDPVGDN